MHATITRPPLPLTPHIAGNLTPSEVALIVKGWSHACERYHDEMTRLSSAGQPYAGGEFGWDHAMVRSTGVLMRNAPIVLWHDELWGAAVKGSEAFADTKSGSVKCDTQVWIWNQPLYIPPEAKDELTLDVDCYLVGALLYVGVPIKGAPPASPSEMASVTDGRTGFSVTLICQPRVTYEETLEDWSNRSKSDLLPRLRFLPTHFGDDPVSLTACAFLAALEFTRLPFVTQEQQRLPRSERRRLQKANQPEPTINVVTLRRKATVHHGEPSTVEWACQWFVRGHWRNQWHPSTKTHAPTYIASYLKGPDDKPLKQPKVTVYNVVR